MKKLKCQHCGNEDVFYAKQKFKGTNKFYFDSNMEETENYEMYDNAESQYTSKFIFCAECNKKVAKIKGTVLDI